MKVYLVYRCSYDDQHVEAVYASADQALLDYAAHGPFEGDENGGYTNDKCHDDLTSIEAVEVIGGST